MRRAYVIGHWGLTLLLAPLSSQVMQYIWGKDPHQVVGLLEVYPITLLFSCAFSFPTFIVYLICFYFLSKKEMNFAVSKVILIGVSVLGIYVTQTIIGGGMSQDIIISYSATAILIGLIMRIKMSPKETQDNIIVV